jgi:hypothetical protein
MGDTSSVVYLLGKTPDDPSKDSWGGRFVRAWERRRYVFDHAETEAPSESDRVEVFSIVELIYRPKVKAAAVASATLVMDRQHFPGFADESGAWHFMLSPKEGKTFDYMLQSSVPELDGQRGSFTSYWLPPDVAAQPARRYPNWWTDDPHAEVAEGKFAGAKTVSRWRADFLRDFAARLDRCQKPAPAIRNQRQPDELESPKPGVASLPDQYFFGSACLGNLLRHCGCGTKTPRAGAHGYRE